MSQKESSVLFLVSGSKLLRDIAFYNTILHIRDNFIQAGTPSECAITFVNISTSTDNEYPFKRHTHIPPYQNIDVFPRLDSFIAKITIKLADVN